MLIIQACQAVKLAGMEKSRVYQCLGLFNIIHILLRERERESF